MHDSELKLRKYTIHQLYMFHKVIKTLPNIKYKCKISKNRAFQYRVIRKQFPNTEIFHLKHNKLGRNFTDYIFISLKGPCGWLKISINLCNRDFKCCSNMHLTIGMYSIFKEISDLIIVLRHFYKY